MIKWFNLPLLAVLVVCAAQPAAAQAAEDRRAVEVSYADLDLRKDAGVKALNMRINRAARTACGREDAASLRMSTAARNCRRAAIADASTKAQAIIVATRQNIQLAAADARLFVKAN